MGSNIIIEPSAAWNYAMLTTSDTPVCLAKNDDFGVEIFMTGCRDKEKKNVALEVFVDNDIEESYCVFSDKECQDTLNDLYDLYLSGGFAFSDCESSYKYEVTDEELSEQREEELSGSFLSLLETVLSADDYEEFFNQEHFDEELEDIKEDVLLYLAQKRGFSVYRPTAIGTGSDKLWVDYPYAFKDTEKDLPLDEESCFGAINNVVPT